MFKVYFIIHSDDFYFAVGMLFAVLKDFKVYGYREIIDFYRIYLHKVRMFFSNDLKVLDCRIIPFFLIDGSNVCRLLLACGGNLYGEDGHFGLDDGIECRLLFRRRLTLRGGQPS